MIGCSAHCFDALPIRIRRAIFTGVSRSYLRGRSDTATSWQTPGGRARCSMGRRLSSRPKLWRSPARVEFADAAPYILRGRACYSNNASIAVFGRFAIVDVIRAKRPTRYGASVR